MPRHHCTIFFGHKSAHTMSWSQLGFAGTGDIHAHGQVHRWQREWSQIFADGRPWTWQSWIGGQKLCQGLSRRLWKSCWWVLSTNQRLANFGGSSRMCEMVPCSAWKIEQHYVYCTAGKRFDKCHVWYICLLSSNPRRWLHWKIFGKGGQTWINYFDSHARTWLSRMVLPRHRRTT